MVRVDELVRGVAIALGSAALDTCPSFDQSGEDQVTIEELITAVDAALAGCPGDGLTIAEAVERDAEGVAVRLGQRITTEGVVTVDAGVFANSKLKVFAQDGGAGIMVYHQTSANVDAFAAGQRLRVTGVIGQFDPTAGADNRGEGTVLIDLTEGSWMVVSDGNPLPEPTAATLADIAANGVARTGTLVRLTGLHKTSGDWPRAGDRSSQVTVADASGGPDTVMRFQRQTITAALADELAAIGDGSFDATVIVVQDDPDPSDGLLDGFELWPRGADDIDG
jgi:hypothetical protein